MNKELSKAIMYRSKPRNIHNERKPKRHGKRLKDNEINVYLLSVEILETILKIWQKFMEQMTNCFGQRLNHF